VGVDNVDVPAATKRGIVVVNAPQSNVVTAAEHTMAMLLALARNIPQAHAALVGGEWARSKYSGVELMDKTLGILGFGRIGQLVAERARSFGMRILALDPVVSDQRFKDLGAERAADAGDVFERADFITIHLPKIPETIGLLDAAAFARMRDGVRIVNVARGGIIDERALADALESGKVGGAALDVCESEPVTEHPLFGKERVVVTPHLGASTAEATDRAGYQAAEQIVAALDGGTVTSAVNAPALRPEDIEVLGPFLPLARRLGKLATALSRQAGAVTVDARGRIAERDVRALGIAVLVGVLEGHTEEQVNQVNAPLLAEERGIGLTETANVQARDFTDLIRVTVDDQRVVGTILGRRERAHLLEAWGRRFNVQLEDHLALFRYRDVPGMIGRVGTVFGEAGINIASAAVGYEPEDAEDDGCAVMVVTTDRPVPQEVVDRLLALDEFADGRAVALA
ncbi:MAG TPA: phosphoglycerate dehydrogenase, partial [Solirubrobacteraceae bacterium]|nr:phosphoglycerate dehydrogenase [Solirubrobacteraceae bacterium]